MADSSTTSIRYRRDKNDGIWQSWYRIYDTAVEITAVLPGYWHKNNKSKCRFIRWL